MFRIVLNSKPVVIVAVIGTIIVFNSVFNYLYFSKNNNYIISDQNVKDINNYIISDQRVKDILILIIKNENLSEQDKNRRITEILNMTPKKRKELMNNQLRNIALKSLEEDRLEQQ